MYQLKKYSITTIDPQALIWNPWGMMCFKNSDYLKNKIQIISNFAKTNTV